MPVGSTVDRSIDSVPPEVHEQRVEHGARRCGAIARRDADIAVGV